MNNWRIDDMTPRSIDSFEGRCVRVITGARLHFGLLDTVPPFGGVGVMVDQPVTEILVAPHSKFDVDPKIAKRTSGIVDRLGRHLGVSALPACRIQLICRSQSHCGLGSGTQTALAIAEALCHVLGVEVEPRKVAVDIAGRGKRSAVGVHGYFLGGLISESPINDRSGARDRLNPIEQRVELPDAWRVVVVRPAGAVPTVSGDAEVQQFASLAAADPQSKLQLLSLLRDEIVPAAKTGQFDRFADAVWRYNRMSGLLFASVQDGSYNGRDVTDVIDSLRRRGLVGIGQSSWGPGVFVWFDSSAAADEFAKNLPANISLIAVAKPLNRPRVLLT